MLTVVGSSDKGNSLSSVFFQPVRQFDCDS